MSLQIREEIEEGFHIEYDLHNVLHTSKSEFQNVGLVDSKTFGKVLILDGLMQSSEIDEFVYHELLVHPAMLQHPNPKTVYIGGGGEGCTAREVLRHKSVEKCVMVDIDQVVVDFCAKHLPTVGAAFADPRLELIVDDAKKRLEDSPIKFDVIILDLDDPIEGGPCFQLYTKSFYEMAMSKLNDGGVLVTQSGASGYTTHKKFVFTAINNTLKQVFPKVVAFNQHVWSFIDEWGWNMAYKDGNMETLSIEEVDKRIAERINGELQFLDGESHRGAFCLSKRHRQSLAAETHVLAENNPKYMYGHGAKE
eukprot:GFYU01001711.1.p1 GENE.GFYU01001711.1~~GFYU01001711.1.p1  ORF type:complete len:327 (-),score=150.60 GFYU01001711.1:22-945(-)